ncbi:hypothetical protein M422DRAFT_178024 [Sphaerobolus stellatus SS14]|uniref:RING-type E3 ubiquitin transferase (cysteine targeting) n=1 Tax=Sphaerobolus stellatus (strain SS14) TaxID=990650 RepID=A0A0C9U3D3_SPHS4|nr:hypothetical protein M422DRAFT_178024 [Sphaerobolus stellatus SS14]
MSPHPPSWQRAWDAAQPHLESIRKLLPGFPHISLRNLRVSQLDAELLDQELLQILSEPISKALGLVQSSYKSRYEPELNLILGILLYKFSVWNTGATYGAMLQNLRYKTPSKAAFVARTPSGLPRKTLLLNAAITIAIPYLHARLRLYALSRSWPDAPSSDYRRKAWTWLTGTETVHNSLGLISFVAFLWDGRYRSWTDRVLGLRLVPSTHISTRQVSYEFMNRQMVWHAFTEFLIFLLPLINTRKLTRRVTRAISGVSLTSIVPSFAKNALGIQRTLDSKEVTERRGKYWSLPADQCAICAENASTILSEPGYDVYSLPETLDLSATDAGEAPRYPLHIPYATNCHHKYCYSCISDRILRAADEGEEPWECLRCEERVFTADRAGNQDITDLASSRSDLELEDLSLASKDFLTSASE